MNEDMKKVVAVLDKLQKINKNTDQQLDIMRQMIELNTKRIKEISGHLGDLVKLIK